MTLIKWFTQLDFNTVSEETLSFFRCTVGINYERGTNDGQGKVLSKKSGQFTNNKTRQQPFIHMYPLCWGDSWTLSETSFKMVSLHYDKGKWGVHTLILYVRHYNESYFGTHISLSHTVSGLPRLDWEDWCLWAGHKSFTNSLPHHRPLLGLPLIHAPCESLNIHTWTWCHMSGGVGAHYYIDTLFFI